MLKLRHAAGLVAITVLVLLVILMSGAGLGAAPRIADVPTVLTTVGTGTGNASNGPEGIAVATSNNRVFVSNSKDNAVYVIDGNTNQVIRTITDGSIIRPWGAAYNPNNNMVYVASNYVNVVVVISADTMSVVQVIGDPSLSLPDQVVCDPVNNLIYVSNSAGGYVTVINGVNNSVAARFFAGVSTPHSIAVDPARSRVYVANLFYSAGSGPDYIVVFSSLSFSQIGTRNAMAGPNGLAVRPSDGNVYVSQNFSDTGTWRVAVVNPLDLSFAYPFPGLPVGGSALMGEVYSPGSDRVYVNGYNSNTVDVIDASSKTRIATLPVGVNPASGITVNPNIGRVYVANRGGGSVTVIQDAPTGPTPTATATATPTATPTPPCVYDSYEPDNKPAQAGYINTAGLPEQRNFCPIADQDWRVLNVEGPETLTMQTYDLQGGADTVMYLYAPDGVTLLAYNDDRGVNSPGTDVKLNPNKQGLSIDLSSLITHSFDKAGQYYLMVKDFNSAVWGSFVYYKLKVTGGPPFTSLDFLPTILLNY